MDVMFVLTISSIFWQGLKIDGGVALKVGGEWANWRFARACWFDICSRPSNNLNQLPHVTYLTSCVPLLTLPYCPHTLLGWLEQHLYASLILLQPSLTLLYYSPTLLYHPLMLSISLPYTSVNHPQTSGSLPYTIIQPLNNNEIEAIQIDIDSKAY